MTLHTWVLSQATALALDVPLSQAEAARAAASGVRGTDFVAGARALRVLAARVLDVAPAGVPVTRTCPTCDRHHGVPRVGELHASVAHAGGLVAVAVADTPVGLDLEPGTSEELVAWTRREALGKRAGTGLAGPIPPGTVVPLPLPEGYAGSLAWEPSGTWWHTSESGSPARIG